MSKAIVVFVAVVTLFLLAAVGALGYLSLTQLHEADQIRAEASLMSAATAPASSGASSAQISTLERKVAALEDQVGMLTTEIGELRSSGSRTPALIALGEMEAGTGATAAAEGGQVDLIRDVIAQENQRREDERNAEREKREIAAAERRAERVAKELNMTSADQRRLTDLMLEESKMRRELIDTAQETGFDRESMRANFEEMRTWRSDALTKTFGSALAEQIEGLDGSPFGDFRRGGRSNRGERSFGGQDAPPPPGDGGR